ncbi:LppX_LprAFG lipoprotein [Micromonospora sp. HM5-17]|uniref:LppX_LprAFG lipoprotein n=1 Tax=Micromonospora sp. HM5-17 TaxID=2487710 RepID=UPI000F466975|nr:LppX_LprAFG lipoprotein [Micromonospora sp. HM5-17]ROT33245.1 LppX_LprAFG lipoprotein [Micromonospora sp. HM5-17]
MRRSLALAGALSLLLAGLVACTGRTPETPGDPADATGAPRAAAGEVLTAAAAEVGRARSVRFAMTTAGSATVLDLRAAEGVVTAEGEAQGSARLVQASGTRELSFVVKGDSLYVNGLTVRWQRVPLSAAALIYDPSALLSPDRGLAHLLATTTGTIEGRESIDGVPCHRIRATLPGPTLGTLVPGVGEDVVGTLWIGVDRPVPHRVTFPLPGTEGGAVTVNLSDYDAAVTIRAPR